ncbi:response regulator [Ornithinimicrobium faecis]|nr:response regulator transcription factor [Ornithinimicrobium sp. HY1793]
MRAPRCICACPGRGEVTPPIRFCVVDDHDIVLLGLEAMASREPDLEFCGGASQAGEAADLLRREQPEILLLDLRLDGENSIPLCAELHSEFPEVSIVMFTAFGNEDLLAAAIRAGAVGYILKDSSTAGLPDRLRTIRCDGSHFDPRIASQALLTAMGSAAPQTLSDRELAIVRFIAEGYDNHEIAAEVHVSVHTVKFHVGALLRRYEVKRRSELVRVLMERQLL